MSCVHFEDSATPSKLEDVFLTANSLIGVALCIPGADHYA